jgi:hypothetical protein
MSDGDAGGSVTRHRRSRHLGSFPVLLIDMLQAQCCIAKMQDFAKYENIVSYLFAFSRFAGAGLRRGTAGKL